MLTMNDVDALAEIFAKPSVMRYIGVQPGLALSREETETAVASIIRHWELNGFGRWGVVDKQTGALIGCAGLRSFENTGEVVYLLDEQYWGKGLATEIAIAAMRYGFETHNFPYIVAFTRPDNIASRRVMEKIGMTFEGEETVFNIFAVRYSITKEDFYKANPS